MNTFPKIAIGAVCACHLLICLSLIPLTAHSQPIAQQVNPVAKTADWIWSADQSASHLYFRQRLKLAEEVALATLVVSSKGAFETAINGSRVSTGIGGEAEQTLYVTRYLQKGSNVLTIESREARSNIREVGVKFTLTIQYKSGRVARVLSNGDEAISAVFQQGWDTPEFDDKLWKLSSIIGTPSAKQAQPAPVVENKPLVAPNPANVIPQAPPKITLAAPPTRVTEPTKPVLATQHPVEQTVPTIAWDSSRLVRLWPSGLSSPARNGEHMIMMTRGTKASELPLIASAGFSILSEDSDPLSNFTENDVRSMQSEIAIANVYGLVYAANPHFAFPGKSLTSDTGFLSIRCLEHNQTIAAFSPWDPMFYAEVKKGYDNLVMQVGEPEVIDVGIHGEYGEAGLFAGSRTSSPTLTEDWKKRFGNTHLHAGWWCADPLAIKTFRQQIMDRYQTLDSLNAAWGTKYRFSDEMEYPKSPTDGSRRRWLDFVNFYRGSVTTMTENIVSEARKASPKSHLSIPIGFSDEDLRKGVDISGIVGALKAHGANVRSTHGGFTGFAQSQAGMLGRIASAAQINDTPLWIESSSGSTLEQLAERIFTAASLGASGWMDTTDNIASSRDAYYRIGKYLKTDTRIVDVAMFYPTTSQALKPESPTAKIFQQGCTEIRDVLDYSILDEQAIRANGLAKYRILVLWEGSVIEADVLTKIRNWVETGGVIVCYDFGKIESVEGNKSWSSDLFGYAGNLSPAKPLSRFSPTGQLAARYRVTIAYPNSAPYLNGDWGGVGPRAMGKLVIGSAEIALPFNSALHKLAFIRAVQPIERAQSPRYEVLMNNILVGYIDTPGDMTYSFRIPASIRSNQLIISIRKGGQSGKTSSGAGPAIVSVQIDQEGGKSTGADPGPPTGNFETSFDLTKLKSEWAKPYGKGWTIYFPGKKNLLTTYYEVVRYLTYHLSEVDDAKRDAVAVDNVWDGVYATLFADHTLYFNGTAKPIKRTISFTPIGQNGKPGDGITANVSLDAHAMSAVYFESSPQELLFQCEGFKNLGKLKPVETPGFFPDKAINSVLIPKDNSISTKIQVDVPGNYRVFYRTTRRGKIVPAEVVIDRTTLKEIVNPLGRNFAKQTVLAGYVQLTSGIHTLLVRPRGSESIRADFVLLTTDKSVGGYGFVSPALK